MITAFLVVVAVPRHERDEQVLAEGQVALLDGGAVSQHGAGLDALAVLMIGRWL